MRWQRHGGLNPRRIQRADVRLHRELSDSHRAGPAGARVMMNQGGELGSRSAVSGVKGGAEHKWQADTRRGSKPTSLNAGWPCRSGAPNAGGFHRFTIRECSMKKTYAAVATLATTMF